MDKQSYMCIYIMISMAVNMAEMLDHIAPFFALCSQGSASPQPGGSTTPTEKLGKILTACRFNWLSWACAMLWWVDTWWTRSTWLGNAKDQTLHLDMHWGRAKMLLLVLRAAKQRSQSVRIALESQNRQSKCHVNTCTILTYWTARVSS